MWFLTKSVTFLSPGQEPCVNKVVFHASSTVLILVNMTILLNNLDLRVTRPMYLTKQALLTPCKHLGSPRFFGRVCVVHLFNFLCCVCCFLICVLYSVLSVSECPRSILDCHSVFSNIYVSNAKLKTKARSCLCFSI